LDDVLVVGINFRSAPVELREELSVAPANVPTVLGCLAKELPGVELALLSTCNRTELYAAAPGVGGCEAALRHALASCAASVSGTVEEHLHARSGMAAAEHLMAVAASLDSMVVGETEILGQTKEAYALAVQAKTCGAQLHTVFQRALKAAKRVHSETDICRGRVSVSSIAVEFAEKTFDSLVGRTVMLIGAGDTAELALKSLVARGVKEILILNRSTEGAVALAEQSGGRPVEFELLPDHLAQADIVISSTSAPDCILRAETVRNAVRARPARPMLLIDIAVPRDIEARAAEQDNVYLYDIDDLQKTAAENLARRQGAVEDAWRIVRGEAAELAAVSSGIGVRHVHGQSDEQPTCRRGR
jgi:glutamyl-tRNA reductase